MTQVTSDKSEVIAGILAGGRSRRMGRPKADLAMADGRTMIEHVAAAIEPIAGRITILGDCASLPALPRFADTHAGLGPLAGIEALLTNAAARVYLVCPCDVPDISTDLLRPLIEAIGDSEVLDGAAIQIAGEPRPEPLPLALSRSALTVVRAQIEAGEPAVHRLIARLRMGVVAVPETARRQLRNVNTPRDLPREGAT